MPTSNPDTAPRRRRALPVALLILATIVGFVSVPALWADRQALETDTWTDTSTELLEDPAIRDAISAFVVNTIYENTDVEAEIAGALPPKAQPLAAPIAGGLRQVATRATQQALEQPQVQGLWENANRLAHERLLRLLKDEGEYASTAGGNVTLDLTSLVSDVAAGIGIGGDIASKLPPGAAEIEILKSDELGAAQTGVEILQTLAWFLTALALILYGSAIYTARGWRREMLRTVGLSFIVIGALDLFLRKAGGDLIVGSLSETSSADTAVLQAWEIGTSLLRETAQSIIAYGLVMVFAAWVAGPSRVATAIRYAAAPYLRDPRYAYAGLTGVLVLLFWWDPVVATGRLVPSILLIAFLAAAVEVLRRQVIREFPDRVPGASGGVVRAFREHLREERGPDGGGAAAAPSRVDELERLASLRDSGVLTTEELEAEKKRILSTA